jgi:TrmH family RNA methyltransferase
MGSTFRLPLVQQRDTSALLSSLMQARVRVLATVPGHSAPASSGTRRELPPAATSLYESDLRAPTALLLGGEGPGLAAHLIDAADDRIFIPMAAQVDSLNVAVAAGVLVYEARRQRAA